MQLDITGHQIDLTDALQQHVRGKMRKLERHSDEITHMHVQKKTPRWPYNLFT